MDPQAVEALLAEAASEHDSLLQKAATQRDETQALVDAMDSFRGEREGLAGMTDLPKSAYDEMERDIMAREVVAQKAAEGAIQALNETKARIRELGGLDGKGGKIAFYGRALKRMTAT